MKWTKEGSTFKLTLDMGQFKEDQIAVVVIDDPPVRRGLLYVRADHKERWEEDGFISRRYEGRTFLPMDAATDTVEAWLTPKGKLLVTAQLKTPTYEKIIPVYPADITGHLVDHPHVSPGGP